MTFSTIENLPNLVRRHDDTSLDEHLHLHEHHGAGRPHHFGMRLDKFAELHAADELRIQFDGGVPLAAGRLARGHRHRLIGERHQHAAMQIAGAVEMLRHDHESPAHPLRRHDVPDRPDQVAESRVVDDLPAVRGRIESLASSIAGLSFMHAPWRHSAARFARRCARSGMSFSALAPATSARPLAPSPRTASV